MKMWTNPYKALERTTLRTIRYLQRQGVLFEGGLSDRETAGIEQEFDFLFPPDLKMLLQTALPVSAGFTPWRTDDRMELRERMERPWEGIVFDLRESDFWYLPWGERPDTLQERIRVAERHYACYPPLIPIYEHRYLPAVPNRVGNPVFSVWQTDVIYYGRDLASYFRREFERKNVRAKGALAEPIEFWSELAEGRNFVGGL